MKKLMLIVVLSLLSQITMAKAAPRVLMMVSEGFYASEYYKPLHIFQDAGFEVTTATKYKALTGPDRRQINQVPAVKPDITFDEINVDDYDAIVFAGGNGAWEDFFPNGDVHKALTGFMKKGKVVALLCSSTGLLGVANNLDGKGEPIAKGRNVTGYKRVEGLLVNLGQVNFSKGEKGKPYVVTDGNLITGRDPISSELFGQTVVKALNQIAN